MYRVSKEVQFCYGHRLLNYDGKCRFLHGHNGRAVITLEAQKLDDLGMVMDFTRIKEVIQTWVDATLDHKMLLHREDPVIPCLQAMGEPFYPMDRNPTAENIARLIYDYAKVQGFPVVEVSLWESDSSCATYRGSEQR